MIVSSQYSRRRETGRVLPVVLFCLSIVVALFTELFYVLWKGEGTSYREQFTVTHVDHIRVTLDNSIDRYAPPASYSGEKELRDNKWEDEASSTSNDQFRTARGFQVISRCAVELVVSLVQTPSHVSTDGGNPCHGFLLRDDMVIASKECSESLAAVHVPGYGNRTVDTTIFSPQHDLALVMLKLPRHDRRAGPEYHDASGWPRQRMFVGENIDTAKGSPFCSTSDQSFVSFHLGRSNNRSKPTVSIFSGQRGRDLVPINGLFAEARGDRFSTELRKLLRTSHDDSFAEMSNERGERWWIQKLTVAQVYEDIQTKTSKYATDKEGALSIANGLGIAGILELEDPFGGRRYSCLARFFRIWALEEPFSGEPFFQWLDYGSGKHIEHPKCSRFKLNEKRMRVFNDSERAKAAVNIAITNGGKAISLTFADTGLSVPEGKWQFVHGMDKQLYLVKDDRSTVGHASVFAGGEVLHAGEMIVCNNGWLRQINSQSGHYRPTTKHSTAFVEWLKGMGVDREALVFHSPTSSSFQAWNAVFGNPLLVPDEKPRCAAQPMLPPPSAS